MIRNAAASLRGTRLGKASGSAARRGTFLRRAFLVAAAASLVACASPAAATPTATPDIEATVEARVSATIAAQPTPTAIPTATPTPVPTPTPTEIPPTMTPVPTNTPAALSTAEIVERSRTFVARIDTASSTGTGFIARSDGYVVTNHHVIEGSVRPIVTLHDGRRLLATVVDSDPTLDLALLRIDAMDLPAATFRELEEVKEGEDVVAIGFALGLDGGPTVTTGIVSAKRSFGDGVVLIQTSAPINPGNSGGPLIDRSGKVVGINTLRLDRVQGRTITGIGFAISSSNVLAFVGRPESARSGNSTPTPMPTARTTQQTVVTTPAELVAAFYRAVDARDHRTGYQMLSRRLRATTTYEQYVGWFSRKLAIRLESTESQSIQGETALVTVVVFSSDLSANGSRVDRYYRESWTLVWEDGGWKLDRVETVPL